MGVMIDPLVGAKIKTSLAVLPLYRQYTDV